MSDLPVIRNRRGERLETAFHPGERTDRRVILAHGVTGNMDRPLLVALAEGLSAAGYPCLRFSFAGNGGSEGRFEAATISKEVEDLEDLLAAQPEELHLAYLGHSMGAAVGALKAARDPGSIRLLVSLAGMVRTADFFEREFGEVTPGEGLMWDEPACPLSPAMADDMRGIGDTLAAIRQVTLPWLFVHGTADDVVPLEDSVLAFAAATGKKRLVEVPEAGHLFDAATYPAVIDAVAAWLGEHL